MGWWTERVVPRLVDLSLSNEQVMKRRREVCDGLSGRVLEIGFGSGLNVGCYPSSVATVDAVEPSDVGWRMSQERRSGSSVRVERVGLDGQRLEADDAAYDAVLSTFTLCTIPDPAAALAEVLRVLRPGGTLHALEHGLAPDPSVVTWQHRLEPMQRRVAGGCHLTRDVPAQLTGAGLRIERLEQGYAPGPRIAKPWGFETLAVATKARAAG